VHACASQAAATSFLRDEAPGSEPGAVEARSPALAFIWGECVFSVATGTATSLGIAFCVHSELVRGKALHRFEAVCARAAVGKRRLGNESYEQTTKWTMDSIRCVVCGPEVQQAPSTRSTWALGIAGDPDLVLSAACCLMGRSSITCRARAYTCCGNGASSR